MVLAALLHLGIYSIQAGNGGENPKPGCVFEVPSGVLWAVHQGTEDIQVSVGVSARVSTLPFKSETCFEHHGWTPEPIYSQSHDMSSGAPLAEKNPKNGDKNCNQWEDWELILLKRHPKSPTLRTCVAFLHGLPGMLDATVPQTCYGGAAKTSPLAYPRKFPRTAMGWGCGTPPNDQLGAI